MRAFGVAFIVGVTVACGSSMPLPQTPGEDAGTEATADATEPFPTDLCKVYDYAVTGHVIDCVGGPCAGRSLAPGASCFDLPVGSFCDLGDHPDPDCNDLFLCNSHHEWDRVHGPRTTGTCSRTVKAGPGCNATTCPTGTPGPCVHPGPPALVCNGGYDCINVDSMPRLGCPCTGPSPDFGFGCYDGVVSYRPPPRPPG